MTLSVSPLMSPNFSHIIIIIIIIILALSQHDRILNRIELFSFRFLDFSIN
jgi:hypothetical protein